MSAPAPRIRTLIILCLASAGWAFAFGLAVPLGALWLRDAGCSGRVIGLGTSVYYLGVAAASLLLPLLLRRPGRRAIVAGMVVDGLVTALFPWGGGVGGWFVLRLLGGVSTALCLVPMETRVGRNAAPGRGARDFGFYAFSVALGVGVGPLVGLPLYPIAPRLAFVLAGGVALLAALLVFLALPPEAEAEEEGPAGLPFGWRAVLFGLGTAWAQGFLEGGMLTFLTPYLLGRGYSEALASGLIAGLFLGVVAVQVPVAWLADRLGRRRVLLGCHAVVLAGVLALPLCLNVPGLAACLFVVGACCAALYPLGLALLGERVPAASLGTANAWYLACNCAGSLSGPWLMGEALDRFGPPGLFAAAAGAVVLVLLGVGAVRWLTPPMVAPGSEDSTRGSPLATPKGFEAESHATEPRLAG
jgi:MFS family permease